MKGKRQFDWATWYGRCALAAGMTLSYAGLYELARAAGIPDTVAWLYPLSVDMPILAAVEAVKRLRGASWPAWAALVLFLGYSMWGNGMHAMTDAHGRLELTPTVRAIVDAAPPLSVLATHALVAAMVAARRKRDEDDESAPAPEGVPGETGRPDPDSPPVSPSGTAPVEPATGTAPVPSGTANTGTAPSTGTASPDAGTGTAGKPVPDVPAPSDTARPGGTGEQEAAVPRNAKAVMLAHWIDEARAGREPTGAELDRVAGVSPKSGLGRRRAKEWREMPLAELQAELAAGR